MLDIFYIESYIMNMEHDMAFREKVAWLTLVSMVIAYSLYFGQIAMGSRAGHEVVPMLWLFGTITVIQMIVVIVGSIIIAARAPREANAGADERDRSIARRGGAAGYYVLMVGMIIVGVVMPFTDTGLRLVNAALLALVIAEGVRHLVILLSYRRGWHG